MKRPTALQLNPVRSENYVNNKLIFISYVTQNNPYSHHKHKQVGIVDVDVESEMNSKDAWRERADSEY
jgi:hypothetical protein